MNIKTINRTSQEVDKSINKPIIANSDYTIPEKPVHVKPSFYAYNFQTLKEIAFKYGYNLVLHGSLNRDMDLIAIPWGEELGDKKEMLKEFCTYLDGRIMYETEEQHNAFIKKHHGRDNYIINLNRTVIEGTVPSEYHQYYLDISITPIV